MRKATYSAAPCCYAQSNLSGRLTEAEALSPVRARRTAVSPASVPVNDAVLQSHRGIRTGFWGSYARVPCRQRWTACLIRLIVAIALRSAQIFAARVRRRRGGCHRSRAGQRPALASRRPGMAYTARAQTNDRRNDHRGGRFPRHLLSGRSGPVIDHRFQGPCRRRRGAGDGARQES